jgi:hypothetical protein
MKIVSFLGAALLCVAPFGSVLAEDEGMGSASSLKELDEPTFPADVRGALVESLRQGSPFSLPHLDTRITIPPEKALVWSGSSVNGETSLATFSLTLQPEQPVGSGAPPLTELDFVVEKEALRVRAVRPVKREFLGGLRFARASTVVRRIALRVDGDRELAVIVPAMDQLEQGFGLVFCLTRIKSEEIVTPSKERKVVEAPVAEPFAISSGRFIARGVIEGRIRSGILPSKAVARISRTANITKGVQELDETLSQDPSVGVTYSPASPPEFTPASRGDRLGAAIKAEIELYTPAKHRQIQTVESEVWIERLNEAFAVSGGGLDEVPKELMPKDVQLVGPIYGSCFAVGGRHKRSNGYTDPAPGDTEGVERVE